MEKKSFLMHQRLKMQSKKQMTDELIHSVTQSVIDKCENLKRSPNVEEIQDMVEGELMEHRCFAVAHNYITYRYERALIRKANSTDKQIMSLLERNNEEVKQENSNKNPTVNSVQRDYMAGEVSKDLTRRILLPEDIVKAHDEGLIHFHDADYFSQHMHNCDLVNLEDMLQNGTVISETMIEKPKSFSTACNVATQIIAQVASSQYGGQSITLSHLAPFVDVSRQKFRKEVKEEFETIGLELDDEKINALAEERLKKEITKGVQTIQYQVVTLMTTNGQAPFITVFMYLNEVPEGRLRDDLAMIIEETLKQRMKGVKNEKGVYITPAFPKLIYALQENNIEPNSQYYYLTELAARCSAKRLVPDYISEKVMKELKRQNQMEILKKGYKIFVLLFSIIIIAYSCRDGGVAAVVNFKPNPIRFSKEGGEYTIKVKGSRGPQWDYTNCTTHSGKEETMKMDTIDNIVHISNDWIEFMFNSGANCKYIDVKVKPNNSDMRRSLIFNVWSVALPTQLAVYQD